MHISDRQPSSTIKGVIKFSLVKAYTQNIIKKLGDIGLLFSRRYSTILQTKYQLSPRIYKKKLNSESLEVAICRLIFISKETLAFP